MADEPKAEGLLAVLRGAVDRHVKQRPRDTIVRNAVEDPAKPLARRVTERDACDFCNRFANGEPVDPAKVSERFHQFCKCHFMLFFQETRYREKFANDKELERIGVTMEEGADPDYHEKRDAMVLAAFGRKVRFLKRHPSGARRADTLVDGELVEFKNPTGSGIYTVQRQIKSNLYGKNKEVMKPQSDVLLISNVNNSMTMLEMQESLAYAFGPESLLTAEEKAYMRKIILLDERTRRVRAYEMKEPALRGSGPRRRQENTSMVEPIGQVTMHGGGGKLSKPPVKVSTGGIPEMPDNGKGPSGGRKKPKHFDKWEEVDLKATMRSFSNDWSKADQAGKGKTRYQSSETSMEFIVDDRGYFRIIDTVVDKTKYWDCVLADGTHLERDKITKDEYQRMTHFRIKGENSEW